MNNGKSFVITKMSEDQQIVFGWANVAIRKDGTVVEDLQDDIIEPEELEKAAYEYVLNFRDAGEKHDPGLRQKGKLVESVVFTKEKIAAMGLPENSVPVGWWVGYKIADRAAWEKIKSGEYRSFSVEGRGERVPVEVVGKSAGNRSERIAKTFSEVFVKFPQYHGCRLPKTAQPALTFSEKAGRIKTDSFAAMSFSEILRKFNPYHDPLGRFTTAGGAASFTYSPGKSKAHDNAIFREKERTKADTNKTPKVEFIPAKTIKEAETFARDKLGIKTVNYGRLSAEVANEVNKSLTEHFNDFPELRERVQFVGSAQARNRISAEIRLEQFKASVRKMAEKLYTSEEDINSFVERQMKYYKPKTSKVDGLAFALSYSGKYTYGRGLQGIGINEKYGLKGRTDEFKKKLLGDAKKKWHPEGTGTIKGVMDHELGHQLDNMLNLRNNPKIQSLYNSVPNVNAMTEQLSSYAHHTKNRSPKFVEFISEGWSEYRNNPNPRPLAKEIGKEIERSYSEWKTRQK